MSPADRRHRSSDLGRAAALDEIASGDPKRMIAAVVKRGGQEGRPSNLAGRLDLSATTMKRTLDDLLSEGRLVEAGERLLHVDAAGQLGQQIRSELQTYHGRHPARAGMAAEELRTRVRASLDGTLFQDLLSWMAGEGEVNFERGTVALTSFTPRRTDAQRAACDALGTALNQGGTTPPRIKDLPDTLGLEDDATDDALHLLLADGTAVRISQELVYDREILERLQGELVEHLQRHGSIDAGGFKELTGASRKWSIPLLEYFDRIKLTVRRGDQRTLRRAL